MRNKMLRLAGCLAGIVLIVLILFLLSGSLHLRQNAPLLLGPWGREGVWISEEQDLLIISRKSAESSSAVKCSTEIWILQGGEWRPCELLYDNSMTAVLYRTGIDVWGDKPFFTARIRAGLGRIVLSDPETVIGGEAEDWLRDHAKIVIRRESGTVPDDPAAVLDRLSSKLTQ